MKKIRTTHGYVTLATLADLTGIHRVTLTRLAGKGQVPIAKRQGKGGWFRVPQLELRRALFPKAPEELLTPPATIAPAGYITVPAAAKQLNRTLAHVYNMVKAKQLGSKRVEGQIFVNAAECATLARAHALIAEAKHLKQTLVRKRVVTRGEDRPAPPTEGLTEGAVPAMGPQDHDPMSFVGTRH